MTDAPARIWAWYYHPSKRDDIMKGGWNDAPDRKEAAYVRADIADDLLAALEGVLRVSDRKTAEYDAARAAIAKAKGGAA